MYPEIDKIEKEQVEWVFGLTGGELADKPLRFAEVKYDPGLPHMVEKWGEKYAPKYEVKRWWRRFYYDGVPEYVARDWNDGANYITIVCDCLFGAPPKKIIAGGKVWRQVALYRSSGETECPGRGNDHYKIVQPEETTNDVCQLCGAGRGEEHGYIYLGDGWAEVVYRSRA